MEPGPRPQKLPKQKPYDIIILGAGGAGLMCAATAAARGKNVCVIDHNKEPGKKILISGGGRCNFTNLDCTPERFISNNPHFAKSALARYTQRDFINLVDRHGISWHEKTLGQLFCDQSAKQIVQMLIDECSQGSVTFSYSCEVKDVTRLDDGFAVMSSNGKLVTKALIVATGGPSIPKLGATGFAYTIAKQFGLKLVEPRPALVPLTLPGEEALFTELSGVATDTRVTNSRASFHEASLFTHKGLSGPAVLQISSYWRHGEAIFINFLPDATGNHLVRSKKEFPRVSLKTELAKSLPGRLVDALCHQLDPSERNLGDYKDKELEQIAAKLAHWAFTPNGSEGFAKAEVTVGGVSTAELSSKTMESKKSAGPVFYR